MLAPAPKYDPAASYAVDEQDVTYRHDGGTDFLARIYRPRGAHGPLPALLDVHGGAWSGGTRESDALMSRALAASGMLVAAIDFRLAPDHAYPASMQDVNYATRWLKAHATDFGASADRMGAIGSSSGGHMAVLSALRPGDERYSAIPLADAGAVDASLSYAIACWPVLDPYARYEYASRVGRADLVERSDGYFRSTEAMQEASPRLLLERGERTALPPTLVVYGGADNNVPVEIIEGFAAAYRAAGGQVELALFPGAVHGFGNRAGADTDRMIEVMKRFVALHLA